MMPTLTAATEVGSGLPLSRFLPASQLIASASATYPPVTAAVLVPPSAWRTSQSIMIEFSPSAFRSMQARSDRPISREISCVRPPIRPFTDSRSLRVLVDLGSIAYSAVIQPSPLPRRQRGTSSRTLAAHSTRVAPNSTSTEPSACSSQPLVIFISRSWPGRRPSGLGMRASVSVAVRRSGRRPVGRARRDPVVDRPHPVSQPDLGSPAEISPGPIDRQRGPLQLARPCRSEHRLDRPARDLADDLGQLEHAHLAARADVPDARLPPVRGRQERRDRVADVDIVARLGTVAEDRRAGTPQHLGAENWYNAGLASRILSWPVDVGEPQHRVRALMEPVVQADVLLSAVLADAVGRLG